MQEKRFTVHKTIGMFHAFYVNDNLTDKVVIDQIIHKYEANRLCDKLNELHEENEQLKETLNLIADAKSFTKEESVKEILRHEIYGIDTAAGESANAFHEYMVLSTFFKKHYKEHWDND